VDGLRSGKMNGSLFGYECVIANQIRKQKKTSKCKIINWFYKKVYGYTYESPFPEGTDIIVFDNKLIFIDTKTFEKTKEAMRYDRNNKLCI
jgi:hypothetical protein